MTIFSVHIRDSGAKSDLAVIPDSFSWGAAVFGFLWALYIGAWDLALVLFLVQAATGAAIPFLLDSVAQQGMAQGGVAVAIGFGAGEMRRALLAVRGLNEAGVAVGRTAEDAERRYLDSHPDVTMRLLGAGL